MCPPPSVGAAASLPADDWDALWGQGDPQREREPPRVSDAEAIRDLFRGAPRPARPAPRDGDDWPGHNYNAAYASLDARRRARTPRAADRRARLEVWDVDEVAASEGPVHAPDVAERTAEVPPTPAFAPVASSAQRYSEAIPTPEASVTSWLDALTRSASPADATEAQIVRTLWGDPRRVTAALFEASDVLHARPRAARTPEPRRVVVRVPAETSSPRRPVRLMIAALLGLALGVGLGVATMALLLA